MGCGNSKDGPGGGGGGASSGSDVTPALKVLEALVTGAGDKFQGTPIPTKKTLATTTVLDLRGLKLDVDGGQAIKDLLPALTALEILQMNDSGLGLAGVRMVAEGLAAFTPPDLQGWDLIVVRTPKLTFVFDRFRPHSLLLWVAAISRFHLLQKSGKH